MPDAPTIGGAKRPPFILFGFAMAALLACCAYLYRGELPPMWLAFSAYTAVHALAAETTVALIRTDEPCFRPKPILGEVILLADGAA